MNVVSKSKSVKNLIKIGSSIFLMALLLCVSSCKKATKALEKAEEEVVEVIEVPEIVVPDWALPGSDTHEQVPPPKGFHRDTRTDNTKIGIFDGQSDVGGDPVPGSSSYDEATGSYTITSAGYNVWYDRDEFRYLWKKMSGDISFAADVTFPNNEGYMDRKDFLIIRESLEDDSKEIMVALHGAGLTHIAWRTESRVNLQDRRIELTSPLRIGIEKKGNKFYAYASMDGEKMELQGEAVELDFEEPFYIGIGFSSHVPAKLDTGIISNVLLENEAGKVK